MEDPREAFAGLELKVDPDGLGTKSTWRIEVCPGAEVPFGGMRVRASFWRAVTHLDSSIRATGNRREARTAWNKRGRRKIVRIRAVKFVCGDARSMEFQSDSFDLVYCRIVCSNT